MVVGDGARWRARRSPGGVRARMRWWSRFRRMRSNAGVCSSGCGWHSLYALGLIEERDAEAVRMRPRGLEFERLALWSAETPPSAPDATHPDTEVLERGRRARAGAASRTGASRGGVPRPRRHAGRGARLPLRSRRPRTAARRSGRAAPRCAAPGYTLVVISNQSGVGRGLFPLSRVYEAMARLRRLLRAHRRRARRDLFLPAPARGRLRLPQARHRGCSSGRRMTCVLRSGASFMVGDKLHRRRDGAARGRARCAGAHRVRSRRGAAAAGGRAARPLARWCSTIFRPRRAGSWHVRNRPSSTERRAVCTRAPLSGRP